MGRHILRDRSPEELALQAKGLIEAKEIFEDLGIPYYLSDGTLLGAYRDGDFIPWDWDVSCCFLYEDVRDKESDLQAAFLGAGFELTKKIRNKKNWKQVYRKYNTTYEFCSWYLEGSWRYRVNWQLPKRFFEKPELIEFYGILFPCLAPIEEYLEFQYGEWQIPKREDRKDVYLHPQVIRKTNIYIKIYRFLLTKVDKLKFKGSSLIRVGFK